MSLTHPLLAAVRVRHGFGLRGEAAPDQVSSPVQVHGARVVTDRDFEQTRPEADAVVTTRPGAVVGVITADCVPVLAASEHGTGVVAIHAGWRGLAAGVVEAGIEALGGRSVAAAAIGPHIGACCYEVDGPVVDALRKRFSGSIDAALAATRPGHWHLDLGALVRVALENAGVASDSIGGFEGACTACDAERFHSYRRDGPRSGRLNHWIALG